MGDNRQVSAIKDYIVKAHKAGACGKYGEHVPQEQMGRVGKGSAYIGTMTPTERRRYRREYRRIFGHD